MPHNEEDELEFKRRVKESLSGDATFTNEIFAGLDLSSPPQAGGSQIFGDVSGLSPEETSRAFRQDPRKEAGARTSQAPRGPQFRKESFTSLVPTDLDGRFVDADAIPSQDRPFNRQILADAASGNITPQVQSMLSSSNSRVRQLAVDVMTKGRKVLDDITRKQAKEGKAGLAERKFTATQEHRTKVEAGKEKRSTRSIEARKEAAARAVKAIQASPNKIEDIKDRLEEKDKNGASEAELRAFARQNGFDINEIDTPFLKGLDKFLGDWLPNLLIPDTNFFVAPSQPEAASSVTGPRSPSSFEIKKEIGEAKTEADIREAAQRLKSRGFKLKPPTFAAINKAMAKARGSRIKATQILMEQGFDPGAEIKE